MNRAPDNVEQKPVVMIPLGEEGILNLCEWVFTSDVAGEVPVIVPSTVTSLTLLHVNVSRLYTSTSAV